MSNTNEFIRASCRNGHEFKFHPKHAGRIGKCKICKEKIKVPATPARDLKDESRYRENPVLPSSEALTSWEKIQNRVNKPIFLKVFVLTFSILLFTNISLSIQSNSDTGNSSDIAYEILREWKPNKKPDGLGMEILLEDQDLTEPELVNFIKQISKGHDPVSISVFLTRAAYEVTPAQENYEDIYDRGHLLSYVKNTSIQGAFQGFNEIRWMQRQGVFAYKSGSVTEL